VLQTTESRFSRSAFLLLGLAFSIFVFAWGLQYKLSLYDPPQAITHQIPEAKLLSKNELKTATSPLLDVSMAAAKALQLMLSSIFLLISLVLNLAHPPGCVSRELEAQVPWQLQRLACLDAFFFRPPPSFA
jgi:hypothetical protein